MSDNSKSTDTASNSEGSSEEVQGKDVPAVLEDFVREFNIGMGRLAE